MKRWYYRIPGIFYAYGPILAESEAAARARIRKTWDLSRLPRGTEVWQSRN